METIWEAFITGTRHHGGLVDGEVVQKGLTQEVLKCCSETEVFYLFLDIP